MLDLTKPAVTQLDVLERQCPLSHADLLERANVLEERAPRAGSPEEQWFLERQAADLRAIVHHQRDVQLLTQALVPVASNAGPYQQAAKDALWKAGCHLRNGI